MRVERTSSQRLLQEPYQLRRGLRAVAARLLNRIAGPEMAGAWDHDAARKEAGVLQRGQKRLRLRLRIDDVVMAAVQQQEACRGLLALVDGGVADRRRIEKRPPVLRRRYAEEFFGDLVAR